MPDSHILIRLDKADYALLRRAYTRRHLTPSQIVRIAVDRFLSEPGYRSGHPFAVPRPVVNDDLEEEEPTGPSHDAMSISARIAKDRQQALTALLAPPGFGLAPFCRGAICEPGHVLDSAYLVNRMLDLVGARDLYCWPDAPLRQVNLDIDAQPDMTRRRGARRTR